MSEYEQPDAVEHRLRFFDGQYLNHLDLVDEQKYHVDRARRLGKALRVTGVADGMEVSAAGTDQVTVAPGTVIDAAGRHLVLASPRVVAIPQAFRGRQVQLLVGYRELPDRMADEVVESARGHRRWHESPQIVAVSGDQQSEDWAEQGTDKTRLAQLTVDGSGRVTVDTAVAPPAGMRVPGDVEVGGELRVGRGTGQASLTAGDHTFSLHDKGRKAVLTVDQASGHVLVGTDGGTSGAVGRVDVGRPHEDDATQAALHLRNGNDKDLRYHGSAQISFGWQGGAQYRHVIRSRHHADQGEGNAIDFFTWNHGTDKPDTPGTELALSLENGKVGIGRPSPRTGLDLGTNFVSGNAVDFDKGQASMVGGGRIRWGSEAGAYVLRWSSPFIVLGRVPWGHYPDGYIPIPMPTAEIPAEHVYSGTARALHDGAVPLHPWEVLYAVHPASEGHEPATLRIASGRPREERDADPLDPAIVDQAASSAAPATTARVWPTDVPSFVVASNWIVLAAVNGNDLSIRLGIGVTVALGGTYPAPAPAPAPAPIAPVPAGTIVMWSGTSIPAGWAPCDGQQGRPDLVGCFVKGAHADARRGNPVNARGDTNHTHGTMWGRTGDTTGASAVMGWVNLYFIIKL